MTDFAQDQSDLDFLDRYLAGEASPAEVRRAEVWLSEQEGRAELASVLSKVQLVGPSVPSEPVYDMAGDWTKLKAQMSVSKPRPRAGLGLSRASYITMGVGAIALLLMVAPKRFV